MAKIKEIFESIQGEGLFVGEKQVFVRFCLCNLNCSYCDTDFKGGLELSEDELYEKIKRYSANSISLTGGEPLLEKDFIRSFLLKYKNKLNKKIHLETNGTLHNNLAEIIDLIDVAAMDIKIKSATGEENRFDLNENFLKIAGKKAFIKIVFTGGIEDFEINEICRMAKKFSTPVILQPKTPIDLKTPFLNIYNRFFEKYENIRLIPQTHTFLSLE